MIVLATFIMIVGYASVNSVIINFSGKATSKKQEGIYITDADINLSESKNADLINSLVHGVMNTTLNSTVVLSETDGTSTAVIDVTIYNGTDTLYLFDGISYISKLYSNENITYEILNTEIGDMLVPGKYMNIKVKFHYLNNKIIETVDKNILESSINFDFTLEHFRWDEYEYNGFDVIQIEESSSNNLKMRISPYRGDWDRFLIPIDNLEIGNYYTISFTEKKTLKVGNTYINDLNNYSYGTTVTLKSIHEAIGTNRESFILPQYFNYDNDPKHTAFMWKEPFLEVNYVEGREYNINLTFYASEETKYWLWDFANIHNNCEVEFNLSNIKLRKIEYPSNKPYISFVDTTYNEWSYDTDYDDDGVDEEQNYLRYSYRTNATENALDLRVETGIGWEYFNIPIKNLTVGTKYKITYNVNTTPTAITINKSNIFGNMVRSTQATAARAVVTSSNSSNAKVSVINKTGTYSDTIEFTATAQTMYWAWQCGGINNYQWANINITNATIQAIS